MSCCMDRMYSPNPYGSDGDLSIPLSPMVPCPHHPPTLMVSCPPPGDSFLSIPLWWCRTHRLMVSIPLWWCRTHRLMVFCPASDSDGLQGKPKGAPPGLWAGACHAATGFEEACGGSGLGLGMLQPASRRPIEDEGKACCNTQRAMRLKLTFTLTLTLT